MKKSHLLLAAVSPILAQPAFSANLIGLFDVGAGGYSIGSFDSANSAAINFKNVTGLNSGETLVSLDYRPASDQVYAIGTGTTVYTIDKNTGGATVVGNYSNAVPGSSFGFDFNPAFMSGTFARIISDTDDNRVISGASGAYLGTDKTDVFYATGDLNVGANPSINHIAYTNSVVGSGSTQQYGIDTDLDILVTVANNAGTLATVGNLGINAGSIGGFDIDGASGMAFAAFLGTGSSDLFSIDLATGSATSIGNIAGDVIGLTAVPEPSSVLLGLAGLGMLARRKR